MHSRQWHFTLITTLAVSALALPLLPHAASANSAPINGPLPPPTSSLIDPQTPERPGYVITASEEFNSTDINRQLFSDEYLPHWSTSPGTKARYQVDNGTLKLTINREDAPWDPARDGDTKISSIQTFNKDYIHRWTSYPNVAQHVEPFRGHLQKYGYFELRAKAAPGGGVHSAWWMTGVNQDQPIGANTQARQSGEVDIFEILGRYGGKEALFSTHTWGDYFKLWPSRAHFGDGSDFTSQWHTYGFEWLPSGMKLYVDGKLVHSTWQSPDYPMMTFIGVYEKMGSSWTGPFDPHTPYPKTFEVDYFRAYQAQPTLPYAVQVNNGFLRGQTVAEKGSTRWLGGEGNDATLTQVWAPADGNYRLAVDFRSGERRDVHITVNDDSPIVLRGLYSGSFGGNYAEVGFEAPLKAGWNTVHFSNPTGDAPDLGSLHVIEHLADSGN
ncbi:family 16 glycosylhydrolase [Schaalia suimastitidis]|uniref:family 16 glycosylhydrolase n=1 Tax=Schaalia suimastitidis TaxID=121163 RepID=UPI0004067EEC|nr:family 16 glycosylhydrolase [Schaalia suimastitidis]